MPKDRPPRFFASPTERRDALAIARIAACNPFLPERIELERLALGDEFDESGADWNLHGERLDELSNVLRLRVRAEELLERLAARLRAGARPSEGDIVLYEALFIFALHHKYAGDLNDLAARSEAAPSGKHASAAGFYERYASDAQRLLAIPGTTLPGRDEIPHLFACFYQARRAFTHIFHNLIGASRPAATFRAAVWQSIFTHDMKRYRRVLHRRMADFTTLITGPSGTGKGLAARAIGLSRYVPFDPESMRFEIEQSGSFVPINLSALSPTLIESELFGHRRGAFTGAVTDRVGWLEICPPHGTIFLDEIGDLDGAIQVKLLRLLQDRIFQRIGDTKDRTFEGKIVTATNRDLAAQRLAGRFRDDLYFRLCSDIIVAPSLEDRLGDSPDELRGLIDFISTQLAGEEGPALADEVDTWVREHLGARYPWPGNVREVEQCVRNVLIRSEYHPPHLPAEERQDLETLAASGTTADEVLQRYCRLVYAREGSYDGAARRLGLDRRTVKSKVEPRPT
jgi:transcriptional regulator with AAA-type ATPase domain